MIHGKQDIKKTLIKLFDDVWNERESSPNSPSVKSTKLNIGGKLIKVFVSYTDDNNIIIKIKHQKAQG